MVTGTPGWKNIAKIVETQLATGIAMNGTYPLSSAEILI